MFASLRRASSPLAVVSAVLLTLRLLCVSSGGEDVDAGAAVALQ